MAYCPYAQRVQTVLHLKNIPHDVVNIDLQDKPEWFLSIQPEGKVPALDTGSEIITKSIDAANYLDEKYPHPPLYPLDPKAREKQKNLIKSFGPLVALFYQICHHAGNKTLSGWKEEASPHLNKLEKFLKEQGTVYFGGDKPGMADYMLWPWAERFDSIRIIYGEDVHLNLKVIKLRAWREAMRDDPVVDALYTGPEKCAKLMKMLNQGAKIDYDNV